MTGALCNKYANVGSGAIQLHKKSKQIVIPMCQLYLSPLALSVLSDSTHCRKHSSEHAEVILNCFKLKLWETIWFYVLIMKRHRILKLFLLLMYFCLVIIFLASK